MSTVDDLLSEVMAQANAGLDYGAATEAIRDGIQAIANMMAELKSRKLQGEEFAAVARSVSHAIKGIDDLVRLVQFAKGAPDSRPDVGGAWLRGLSDEQLRTVERWVSEAAKREKA